MVGFVGAVLALAAGSAILPRLLNRRRRQDEVQEFSVRTVDKVDAEKLPREDGSLLGRSSLRNAGCARTEDPRSKARTMASVAPGHPAINSSRKSSREWFVPGNAPISIWEEPCWDDPATGALKKDHFEITVSRDEADSTGFHICWITMEITHVDRSRRCLDAAREGDEVLAVNGVPVTFLDAYKPFAEGKKEFILTLRRKHNSPASPRDSRGTVPHLALPSAEAQQH